MRKYRLLAAVTLSVVISAGPDFVAHSEPSDLGCQTTMSALTDLRDNLTFPPYFSERNPAKRGGEFDPNQYFRVFTHLKMRDGFTLDYVYHQDGMGGYPVLYARPVDQASYLDEAAFRAAGEQPDYLGFVVPQDTREGYFEYAVFAMMANQFYLDWHANYNDWRVVCDTDGIDEIIASLQNGESIGRPMSPLQQQESRAIEHPAPAVALDDQTATVTMLAFTKWGGFYRRTLVIDRQDHSIRDEQNLPLVEYECGIAF